VKDILESMKLAGPSNYMIWSYKVKMILMQGGLWKYIEPIFVAASSSASVSSLEGSRGAVSPARGLGAPTAVKLVAAMAKVAAKVAKELEQRFKARKIIISMVRDSIILSIIHLTDPLDIWSRLKSMYDVKSSSRYMSLKEKFYSLCLSEEKV
jgi:hypothetical protein